MGRADAGLLLVCTQHAVNDVFHNIKLVIRLIFVTLTMPPCFFLLSSILILYAWLCRVVFRFQPAFSPLEGTKITVNNLHPRVTEEDIVVSISHWQPLTFCYIWYSVILWVLWCCDDSLSKCLHSPPFVHRNCSVCVEPWSEHDWWRWAWLKWCSYVKRMPWAHTGSTTTAAWTVSASGKDAHIKGLSGFWALASVLHAGQRLHYCWQVNCHLSCYCQCLSDQSEDIFLFLFTDFWDITVYVSLNQSICVEGYQS